MSDKGMFGNLGNLMKQAQAMQERLAKVQAEVATKTVQASAGGGQGAGVANSALGSGSDKNEPASPNASDGGRLPDPGGGATQQTRPQAAAGGGGGRKGDNGG